MGPQLPGIPHHLHIVECSHLYPLMLVQKRLWRRVYLQVVHKSCCLGYQTAAIALKMTALSMKLIIALSCISAFCLGTGVADTCPATASVQCIPAWSAWKRWAARTLRPEWAEWTQWSWQNSRTFWTPGTSRAEWHRWTAGPSGTNGRAGNERWAGTSWISLTTGTSWCTRVI